MSYQPEIQTLIDKYTRDSAFHELHWDGTMAEYLVTATQSPEIVRNTLQRNSDMIISHWVEGYIENRKLEGGTVDAQ
jgi:hypothetical protein